jgi:quinol monooxygenase YgiN
MNNPLTLVVTLKAKPEHAESVGRDLMALLAATRQEAGCVEYHIHRSVDQASTWMVYETWASQAAFDSHLAQPYTQAFMGKLPVYLDQEIDIASYLMQSPRPAQTLAAAA